MDLKQKQHTLKYAPVRSRAGVLLRPSRFLTRVEAALLRLIVHIEF